MKLYSKSTVNRLREEFNFQCTKSLGQNFLLDKNIIDKIVDSAHLSKEDLVVEVGPGMGVLTQAMAPLVQQVLAVEIDGRLIPVLEKTLKEYDNVNVVQGDILQVDLKKLIDNEGWSKDSGGKVCLVANLPYYITSAIIMKVLEEGIPVESMTVMMQREVALRMNAAVGTKDYGALTVMVQYYCRVKSVTRVPREVFTPMPRVDSMVIQLIKRKEPPVPLEDPTLFFQTVKQGFGQRRKTLLNAMNGFQGCGKEEIKQWLDRCHIDARRRGETLTMEEFAHLANTIARSKKEGFDRKTDQA